IAESHPIISSISAPNAPTIKEINLHQFRPLEIRTSDLLASHSVDSKRQRKAIDTPLFLSAKQIVLELTQLYLSNRTRISRAVWITLFVALVNRVRHAISEQKAASARESAQREARKGTVSATDDAASGEKPKKKVALDREFFRSLMRLVKIVIPGWKSKEARLLISHSFFLILRTLISVKVAEMDGAIVKALVKGQGKEFLMRIMWWMIIAIPATFTNSMVNPLLLPYLLSNGANNCSSPIIKQNCRSNTELD
ncbi:hypothetical protein Golomagni_08409, partial [Golovinomyces magnicellulatus]